MKKLILILTVILSSQMVFAQQSGNSEGKLLTAFGELAGKQYFLLTIVGKAAGDIYNSMTAIKVVTTSDNAFGTIHTKVGENISCAKKKARLGLEYVCMLDFNDVSHGEF